MESKQSLSRMLVYIRLQSCNCLHVSHFLVDIFRLRQIKIWQNWTLNITALGYQAWLYPVQRSLRWTSYSTILYGMDFEDASSRNHFLLLISGSSLLFWLFFFLQDTPVYRIPQFLCRPEIWESWLSFQLQCELCFFISHPGPLITEIGLEDRILNNHCVAFCIQEARCWIEHITKFWSIW